MTIVQEVDATILERAKPVLRLGRTVLYSYDKDPRVAAPEAVMVDIADHVHVTNQATLGAIILWAASNGFVDAVLYGPDIEAER